MNFLKIRTVSILICASNIFVSMALADWYPGYGSIALTKEQTLGQCLSAALQVAKTDAFSKAGLERFSSQQIEICSDNLEVANCELHQQTLNYYDGAYIAGTRNVDVRNTASECIASVEADVRAYKSQHDPDFGLSATIRGSKNKRHGDVVQVSGETSERAYVALYIWSPSSNGEQLQLIFPNQFDNENLLNGKFSIPSAEKSRSYQLYAEFPEEQNTKTVSEIFFILASKSKFEMLSVESSENFFKRLDELGRENWRLERIGYTIFSE